MHRPTLPLLLLLLGCPPRVGSGDGADGGGTAADGPAAALIGVSIDYAVGTFSTVSIEGWSVAEGIFPATGDSTVVVDEGKVLVLNRFGYDTMQIYEPGSWSAPQAELSLSEGELSTNPQDAATCGGKLFVSLLSRDWLGIWDPETGVRTGKVDLSAFNDSDGVGPEPIDLVVEGSRLWVALQRLDEDDGWVDEGGMVVAIDCATEEIEGSWSVAGNTRIFPWPDHPGVLAAARAYGEDPAGIYAVDATSGARLLAPMDSLELVPTALAAWGERAIATVVTEDGSSQGIACVDLGSGESALAESTTRFLTDIAGNELGEAWVGAHWGWLDPDAAEPGVLVYDIEGCSSLTPESPISLTLAPYSIAFY